jgi:hypothetical protein
MMKLSFSRSDVDQAVFYRRDESSNRLIIILVHINDYSIMATSTTLITQFKAKIKTHVHITDMGDLHWILSIKVKRIREEGKILLSQSSYIDSILQRYNLDNPQPVSAPIDPNICLTSADSPSTMEAIAVM